MKKIVLIFVVCCNSVFAAPFDSNITNGCDNYVLYANSETQRALLKPKFIPIKQDVKDCNITNLYAGSSNNKTKLKMRFISISYTCSAGSFLPANTTGCRACPSGYICPGGTFGFNERQAQGINRQQVITQNLSNGCAENIISFSAMRPIFVEEGTILTVNFKDGENTETQTCTYGDDLTLPEPPTRVGYTFTGWKVKNE